MTSRPFLSLYFSNFSGGTSSGAGLGAGFFVCAAAGAFFAPGALAWAEGAFCPVDGIAKLKNAATPSNKTPCEYAFIKAPLGWYGSKLNPSDHTRRLLEEPISSLPAFWRSASVLPDTMF